MSRSSHWFEKSSVILKAGLIAVVLGLLTFALPVVKAQTTDAVATVISPQEPATLLPHFDLLTLTHEVEHLLYDCLLNINEAGEFTPQLVTEVPSLENGGISADGKTYTLHLRDDVRWHDGQPLTSADVEFTWRVITNPSLAIPTRIVWQDITSIETPDDQTVIVSFPTTNLAFLARLATDSCFVLPKHLLDGTDITNSPLHRSPVGTGPFVFKQWVSGSFIEVERNPNYFKDGVPTLDRVTVLFVPTTAGQRTLLERGDADLQLHLTSADVSFVRGLSNYSVVTAPSIAFWLFWLNNEDPILQDVRVRQALTHGLDKLLITETVMENLVEPLDAVFPPAHWAHNPNVRKYAFDQTEAAALLESAGWVLGNDGIRGKEGQKLRLEITNIAGQAERLQIVQIVQSLWREIGIDATIREIEAASFPPTLSGGQYQVAYGFFGESQEPVFNLWLGTNWQRYRNEEAYAILAQVPTTVDRNERLQLIQRFQEIVAEDVPVIPLAPRVLLNAANERLDGYLPTLSGSLWNASEWSLTNE